MDVIKEQTIIKSFTNLFLGTKYLSHPQYSINRARNSFYFQKGVTRTTWLDAIYGSSTWNGIYFMQESVTVYDSRNLSRRQCLLLHGIDEETNWNVDWGNQVSSCKYLSKNVVNLNSYYCELCMLCSDTTFECWFFNGTQIIWHIGNIYINKKSCYMSMPSYAHNE